MLKVNDVGRISNLLQDSATSTSMGLIGFLLILLFFWIASTYLDPNDSEDDED